MRWKMQRLVRIAWIITLNPIHSFNHVIRESVLDTHFDNKIHSYSYIISCVMFGMGYYGHSPPFLIGFAKTYDEKLYASSILMCDVLAKEEE